MATPRLALAASLLLAACAATGEKTDFYWSSPADALRVANPADVAVLDPTFDAGEPLSRADRPSAVPLERFRQATYRELLKRRYSPLALDYVDRAWRGASASSGEKGMCGEDAYLRVSVNRFEVSAREPQVRIAADFFLHDGKTGTMLWSAKADRRIDLKVESEVVRDPALLRRTAVERFVESALQGLPARVPASEPR